MACLYGGCSWCLMRFLEPSLSSLRVIEHSSGTSCRIATRPPERTWTKYPNTWQSSFARPPSPISSMLVAIGGSPCEWTEYPNTRNTTMSISSVLSTLILWGRGAKHARCFSKVFGYYVHLLSKNIAGLAVHGGNGAVKICGFLFFFVVVASGFGGNGDEP